MKDWQILSFQVAIFTGIITAILALIQAFLSLREKKKIFTFERLKIAKELIDDIYELDNKAPKALLMIDGRKVEYKNNKVGSKDELKDALEKEILNEKCDFIRDCFDELFFFIERIQHSIDCNLIKFEDIKPYFNYYVNERIKKNKELYIGYAKHIHYEGVSNFINLFN